MDRARDVVAGIERRHEAQFEPLLTLEMDEVIAEALEAARAAGDAAGYERGAREAAVILMALARAVNRDPEWENMSDQVQEMVVDVLRARGAQPSQGIACAVCGVVIYEGKWIKHHGKYYCSPKCHSEDTESAQPTKEDTNGRVTERGGAQ
jgi:hypothetical protein